MAAGPNNSDRGIDALLPAEIAEKAETVGVLKARRDVLTLLVLAILAGAFIALGAMFATTVLAGADGALPFGLSRLLAGVAFCLGLILVILGGAELFTGNTLMVMAWAAGKLRLRDMLRAWLIVYVGNFIGAVGTALLVFLSGQYLAGRGAVTAVVLTIAHDKATLP
jgi:formate/nitrite transporter FocA (FNT family)